MDTIDKYNIDIYKRRIDLTPELGHIASASSNRGKYIDIFKNDFLSYFPDYSKYKSLKLNKIILGYSIEKYSEQLVANPINDLSYWYKFRYGRFILPGYPKLYYMKGINKLSSNKSAVAAVGEGLAGLISEWVYKCFPLARPNHDFPDIVMRNNNCVFLVEAKAVTDSSKIKNVLDENIKDLVSYTHSCDSLDDNSVVGLLYGTKLIDEYNFEVYINEIVNPLVPMLIPDTDYINLYRNKIINLDNELLKNLNLSQNNKILAGQLLNEIQKDKSIKLSLGNKYEKMDAEFIKSQIYQSKEISDNVKNNFESIIDQQLKEKNEIFKFIDEKSKNIMGPGHPPNIRTINNQKYEQNSFSLEPDKLNYIISPLSLNERYINDDLIEASNREWFPYDFIMEGYINIIDQDGSIRIYTNESKKVEDDSIKNIINNVY